MTPDLAAELAACRPKAELDVAFEPDALAAFSERGFATVERITTDEELAWLCRVYDALFDARRGAFRGGYFDLSRPYESEGPDRLPQVILPELAVPALRETAFWRNGRTLAAQLLGCDADALEGWGHMIRKPPRIGEALPWHQDEAYWDPAFDYRAVGCWTTLDPATADTGCLRFVPGSHRGGVRPHRHIRGDPSVHGIETWDVDEADAVLVPAEPGAAVFHDCRMLHASLPNRSERARRAYANEWQLAPIPRDEPYERPWYHDGKRAWSERSVYADRAERTERVETVEAVEGE